MLKQYKLKDYDFRLVAYVVVLTIIGILVIGSANSSVQGKQILGLVLGLITMVVVSLMDYEFLLRFSWIFYFINIVLLTLVLIMGDKSKGATRWVEIAGIRFQPSELGKILLILFFAYFFAKYQESVNRPKVLIGSFILAGIPLALIKKEPDLSTTIVTALIFLVLLFMAGLSYKFIATVLAVSVPSAAIFLTLILQPDQKILRGYQYKRIMGWLQPEKYADKTAVYCFTAGKGYVTTDKFARNITELAFFVPDFDNGDFTIHAVEDLEFLCLVLDMTEGDHKNYAACHTTLPIFRSFSETHEYTQDCKGPHTRSWQVLYSGEVGRNLLGVVKAVGEGTVEKGHPAVDQWNYGLDNADFTLTVENESVAHHAGDWSFVPAGLDHSLTAEPGKEVAYIWFERFVKEREA